MTLGEEKINFYNGNYQKVNIKKGLCYSIRFALLLFTANRSRISIKNLFPLYVFYNVQHEKTDSYIYFL